MRSLFLKVFGILWVAQSLIFVITTALIIRHHFIAPDVLAEALDSNLRGVATAAMAAYAGGGCPAFRENSLEHEPSDSYLLDPSGRTLCSTSGLPLRFARPFSIPDRIFGRQEGDHYLWLVPVVTGSGAHLVYVWLQPPLSNPARQHSGAFLHFAFPQAPVAIAVGGVTTFFLVLLLSRPLVRLRRAARELAQGNLAARVPASSTRLGSKPDEVQGLVQDFNDMAERLEALVGAQQLLLRDVSHELRSPLARLSVALELTRDDAGPQLAAPLARIEREADRLNQLIGELLSLSSLEARDDVSAFGPVSLNRICEAILPDADYEAQLRPCTVRFEQTRECSIRGDWNLLYRAIENVVRNAIRYTAPGTQVTVRLSQDDQRAETTLEVQDHGPGIPEGDLAHIFRPFYRVDQSRTSSTGGSGVGLAITDRSVKLHGGTIRAFARTGGGTCISMIFPRG